MNINVNGVEITLTKEQLEQIAKQTSKKDYKDITSYSKACNLLDLKERTENDYPNRREWIYYQLITIADAINSLLEGDKKWYPYFNFKPDDLGLVFYDSYFYDDFAAGRVALLKTKEASDFVGKTFLHLYEELHSLR